MDIVWTGDGVWEGWSLVRTNARSIMLVDPDGIEYRPDDIQHPVFVGQKEIGELLGWSKQQVNNYVRDGRLPAPDQTIGGRPAWRRKKIEAYRNERGYPAMKTWETKLVTVQEVAFEHDLHAFDVYNKEGKLLGGIYPDDIDAMQSLIDDLNGGSCPIADHWEDGMGNTCNLDGWGENAES